MILRKLVRDLEGGSHRSQVKLHYDSFKGWPLCQLNARVTVMCCADVTYSEPQKPPCQNLLRKGFCEFGVNCRFSHYIVYAPAAPQRVFKASDLPPSLAPPPEAGYDFEELNKAQWG